MRIASVVGATLILAAASRGMCGAALRAGVARAEITPPAGEQMWGYEDRRQPATGMLDPLYARVLVLEAGPESAPRRLALVTLDLGRSFGPGSLARPPADTRSRQTVGRHLVSAGGRVAHA